VLVGEAVQPILKREIRAKQPDAAGVAVNRIAVEKPTLSGPFSFVGLITIVISSRQRALRAGAHPWLQMPKLDRSPELKAGCCPSAL
jgi:hypothetical protein